MNVIVYLNILLIKKLFISKQKNSNKKEKKYGDFGTHNFLFKVIRSC